MVKSTRTIEHLAGALNSGAKTVCSEEKCVSKVGSARKREPEPVGVLKWSEANRTRIAMAPHEANPNPFKNVAIPTSLP